MTSEESVPQHPSDPQVPNQLLTYLSIMTHIKENRSLYETRSAEIQARNSGRICHHKVLLLNVLVDLVPSIRRYLEIGVHNGASMSYVVKQSRAIDCYGVDLFDMTYGHYLRDSITLERTRGNIESNNEGQSVVRLIKGNSRAEGTIEEVRRQLDGRSLDLLFLDGDHSYEGVRADFENFSDFVREGGLIVLDDYSRQWPGVVKFGDEIDPSRFRRIGVFFENELLIEKLK